MTDPSPTLPLDVDDPAPAADPSPGPTPLVFPTNRYNALEVLSSRLIAPREAYDKYYDDLLALAPGYVAIVRAPVGTEIIELVAPSSDETTFPVLIEVDSEAIGGGTVSTLGRDGKSVKAKPSAIDGLGALPVPVAAAAVIALHFRSDNELEEHRLRDYRNIDHRQWDLRVSPELFADESGVAGVADWLGSLPKTEAPTDYHAADRLTGALTVLASSVPVEEPWFELLAGLLVGGPPGRAARSVAPWLRADLLDPAQLAASESLSETEDVVFAASAEVMSRSEPHKGWKPQAVLDEIHQVIGDRLSSEGAELVDREFAAAKDVLDLRRDFEPLNPEGAVATAQALLLVLLRPEPDRLLAWAPDETGATAEVMATAAALTGLLHGRREMDVASRPLLLDSYLSGFIAQRAEPGTPGRKPARTSVDQIEVDDGEEALRLSVGGTIVLERRVAPPPLAEILAEADLDVGEACAAAVRLATEMGWTDCRIVTINLATGRTGHKVTVGGTGKTPTLTVQGIAEVVESVDRDRFLKKLAAADIPATLEAEVRKAARSSRPERPRASGRR